MAIAKGLLEPIIQRLHPRAQTHTVSNRNRTIRFGGKMFGQMGRCSADSIAALCELIELAKAEVGIVNQDAPQGAAPVPEPQPQDED